jgi:hypothetical protein
LFIQRQATAAFAALANGKSRKERVGAYVEY